MWSTFDSEAEIRWHCEEHAPKRGEVMPKDSRVESQLASLLIGLQEQAKPFHEFLDGEKQLFLRQGYTDDEARSMAAALFVCLFGQAISRTKADGDA
jgi:hypothetical protein